MSGSVDTTPAAQGKRKRPQKEKTPALQGSKRVKSQHEDVAGITVNGDATPVSAKQSKTPATTSAQKSKSLKKASIDTPSKKPTNEEKTSKAEQNAVAVQQGEKKRLRRPAKSGKHSKERRRSVATTSAILPEAHAAEKKGAWSVSRPTGGRFIPHDPIVSTDDSYVFASNGREVQVLSVATSLVERNLAGPDNNVSAFALSPSDSETIYIASSRRVQCWEWISGAIINDPIEYKGKIHALCAAPSDDASDDLLYTICEEEGEWKILAGDRTVYTSQERLSHLSLDASYIMAASATKLVVGRRSAPKADSGEEAHFTFLEIASSVEITCLGGRAQAVDSQKKKGPSDILTVATGNVEGQIMVYEDVFSTSRPAGASLMPRILHWHREAVASLKWSQDGNYLISGGRETTLVLWQLATGKKQFLPHLTAEIERLTVSPSGTSYAIQLADNSVMVLSTTELKPVANFAGLQAQTVIHAESGKVIPSAAAIHPIHKDQLLLAVPPSRTTSARPFLQTYDITTDRHISRQALTRNNVTDFNKGPEGNKIQVPDASFIKISVDGQWLATAEEWCPPAADLDYLSADRTGNEQRSQRMEVYLKIWRWDDDRSVWVLESRIDNPHQIADGAQPARVLGLTADPVETGFATIGEDSSVRVWKPKTRLRNGLVVRGANSEGLVDWSCRHTIQLDQSVELTEEDTFSPAPASRPTDAAFAYSEDGSMLAASQVFKDSSIPPVVSFINTTSGAIEQTRANLFSGTIKALDFLERNLILVSDSSIHVWDVISESLVYRTGLAADPTASAILLAVNHEDHTFALSMSLAAKSHLRVYNTSSAQPELSRSLSKPVSALLTVPGRKGYTILASTAEIHTLLPKTAALKLPAGDVSKAVVAAAPLVDAQDEDEDADMEVDANDDNVLAIDDEEADKPIVRPEQLARVFDGPNVALIPVREMFDQVLGLYARKPRETVAA